MHLSLLVDVPCGADIKDACEEAINLANKFDFNDKIVLVFPHTDLNSLVSAYYKAQKNNDTFVCTLEKLWGN